MITADTSVWIDFLNERETPQTQALINLLRDASSAIVLLDVVLMEILRGVRSDKDYQATYQALLPLTVQVAGGKDVALAAAVIYRQLRRRGLTIRSSIDLLVAAWCVTNQCVLIHSDRDFDSIAQHYPLRFLGDT
jgi:predicted nucleic acid-binding protein